MCNYNGKIWTRGDETMSDLARGRLCVVHNNMIEASSKLGVLEQRIIAYLTSLIGKDDSDFQTYPVAIKDLQELLDLKRKDFYKDIKNTTKGLMKKVMSLKPLDGKPGEIQVAWLSRARYIDGEGVVQLRFDPELKPYLLQLKAYFTKYPLEDVVRFKSQFSMPIYLLLKQYLTVGNRTLTVDDLKTKLELGTKYAQFGIFKLRVLNTAVKEINEKTGLDVDFTEVRTGRSVTAIRFEMRSKPPKTEAIDMFSQMDEPDKKAENLPPVAPQETDLLQRFARYGVPKKVAQGYIDKFGGEYCACQLDYTSARQEKAKTGQAKPIDNIVTWINGCMLGDYAQYVGQKERLSEQEAEKEKSRKIVKRAQDEIAATARENAKQPITAGTINPQVHEILSPEIKQMIGMQTTI